MDVVIQVLVVISYFLHSLFKNVLVGGVPVMAVAAFLGSRQHNDHLRALSKIMLTLGPAVLGGGIGLGVLALVLLDLQYVRLLDRGAISFGTEWGALIVVLLGSAWGILALKTYAGGVSSDSTALWRIGGLTLAGLLGMTFFFVANHVALLQVEPARGEVGQNQALPLWAMPTVWPRFFHMVLSSLAVTGLAVALYGTWRMRSQEARVASQDGGSIYDVRTVRHGVAWMLGGTLPQILVGPWLLLALPHEIRNRLVDGEHLGSLIFFASLTFALLALVLLNASLMAPHVRGLVWSGSGCLLLTTVLMVLVREDVKLAWLAWQGFELPIAEPSGWAVIGLLGCLLGGGIWLYRVMMSRLKARGSTLPEG